MAEQVAIEEGLFTWPSDDPRLLGSQCQDCGAIIFPMQSGCPRCASDDTKPKELGTRGKLWTWTIQGYPPKSPPYAGDVENFEPFHPERIAQRILGMGDIVSLVEKAAENIDKEEMEDMAKKIAKGKFDLEDFANQLKQMGKMGGVSCLLSMMPGVSKAQKLIAENKISNSMNDKQIAIISSMTKKERSDPDIIKASRKIRISKGSGTKVQDVNRLSKQFLQSQKMMKRMKSMGKGGIPSDLMQKLQGNLPPNIN